MKIPRESTEAFAIKLRQHVLRMTHHANASHVGSCLSCADLVAVLYQEILRIDPNKPDLPGRDRFILSKGHAGAIVYAALAERGFFPLDWLNQYCDDGSPLSGHMTHTHVPGVEVSTGSLGHGLPIASGMALHIKRAQASEFVYVIMSDGELDEGSNWESMLFAGHHKLNSLIVFLDYNKIQSYGRVEEVINLEPMTDKWNACHWHTQNIDGHDHHAITDAVQAAQQSNLPSVIIAHTIKGKGISFMEDQLLWHYRSPRPEELTQALAELEEQL